MVRPPTYTPELLDQELVTVVTAEDQKDVHLLSSQEVNAVPTVSFRSKAIGWATSKVGMGFGLALLVLVIVAVVTRASGSEHGHSADACKCDNGEPTGECPADPKQNGTATKEEELQRCKSCNEFFHLDSDSATNTSSCEANKCKCGENGKPVEDKECKKHDQQQCVCNAGYHTETEGKSIGQCAKNQCKCGNGSGTVGSACKTHGEDVCSKCNKGFKMDAGVCKANKCTCKNGEAVEASKCDMDGEKCDKCAKYYQKSVSDANKCVKVECKCPNGKLSDNCEKGAENSCKTCNDGFHLEGNKCKGCKSNCLSCNAAGCNKCENGFYVDTVAGDCKRCNSKYGACKSCNATQCNTCKEDHFLNSVEPKCKTCQSLYGPACVEKKCNNMKCTECSEGYTADKTSGKCKANNCTCPGGVPRDSTKPGAKKCLKDKAVECESCLSTHTITSKNECTENECKCTGGTPNATCTKHKAEDCSECQEFYNKIVKPGKDVRHKCERNDCKCDNGESLTSCTATQAVKGRACNASKCKEGYHSVKVDGTDGVTCEQNKCKCINGEGKGTVDARRLQGALEDLSDIVCPEHGSYNCAKCDYPIKLVGIKCPKANAKCMCPNGEKQSDDECSSEYETNCRKCDAGYKLVDAPGTAGKKCVMDDASAAEKGMSPVIVASVCGTVVVVLAVVGMWFFKKQAATPPADKGTP